MSIKGESGLRAKISKTAASWGLAIGFGFMLAGAASGMFLR
jgi:hypothetical protein